MNIIVLIGRGGTGKSTTLIKLILKLLGNGAKPVVPDLSAEELSEAIQQRVAGSHTVTDEVVVLKLGAKTIGITTRGDSKQIMETDFNKLGSCDLYICAARTRGETVNFVQNIVGDGLLLRHSKWWIRAGSGALDLYAQRDRANELQAEELLKEISTGII